MYYMYIISAIDISIFTYIICIAIMVRLLYYYYCYIGYWIGEIIDFATNTGQQL